MIKIVVGLGNPGSKYKNNRHNIGFMAVDAVAGKAMALPDKEQCNALVTTARLGGKEVWLVKPQTYMNLSGEPVAKFLKKRMISPEHMLVIHDDIDIPLGDVRLKDGGGHAGHNGIRSIIDNLGTREFRRIRMGVSRPPAGIEVAEWVLSSFMADETIEVDRMVDRSYEQLLSIIAEG